MKLFAVAIATFVAATTAPVTPLATSATASTPKTKSEIMVSAQPEATISPNNACRQQGAEYQKVYSFDTETHSITICQKGQQYYYVQTQKSVRQVASR